MTNRHIKSSGIFVTVILLALTLFSPVAFAQPVEDTEVTTTEAIQTEPSGEAESTTENAPSTTEVNATEAPTKSDTVSTTAKKNTSTTATTKRSDSDNGGRNDTPAHDDDDDGGYVWAPNDNGGDDGGEEEEEKGFTVYIELNNGEERKRFDLEEPGTVPEPTEKPTREGFKFGGWFADPEFKTKWDFEKDIAEKETVIYVKWVPDEGTVLYKITVTPVSGGVIEVNPSSAAADEHINITVIPGDGKRLKDGCIYINGEKSELFSFVMPSGNVTVSAEFETVTKAEEKASSTKLIVIIGAALFAIVAAVGVAVTVKRKNALVNDELDEDWLEESVTAEDGFKDGKVVKEISEDEMFSVEDEDDSEDDIQ